MNPNHSDEVKAFLTRGIKAGGYVSDGPVADTFTAGWALHPFVGKRAHYWDRRWTLPSNHRHAATLMVGSLCGQESPISERLPLLGVGNFSHCELCDRKLLRGMKSRGSR